MHDHDMRLFTGTTPTYILIFPENEVDFLTAEKILVTIEDNWGKKLITKTEDDLEEVTSNTIQFSLSQEETLSFDVGNATIQVNWTYQNSSGSNKRACSDKAIINIDKNSYEEVI